jgi:hypothetical protein
MAGFLRESSSPGSRIIPLHRHHFYYFENSQKIATRDARPTSGKLITGVMDTSGKFTASAVETSGHKILIDPIRSR